MLKVINAILFVVLSQSVFGSVISGENKTYAGKELLFLEQADPFTGVDSVIGRAIIDSAGKFSVNLDITETTYVYSKPGVHLLFLFVEPNKNYEVILPDFKAKTKGDMLNPFFSEINVHLATKEFSDKELNLQIRMFLNAYIPYKNKHIDKVFTDQEFEQLDRDIRNMEKPFAKSKNTFFNEYREYKYGMLRFLAYQHKSKTVSDKYFKNKPVLYKNPAYLELFNMVYEKYFQHFSRADTAKNLARSIRRTATFNDMKNALSADSVLQPTELLNMVALKGMYNEFYDDNYSRFSLLHLLDSFIETEENTEQVRIAKNIRTKVTRLLAGFEPPKFNLYDIDSNLVSLNDFKGKFVYLNFCSCFSYSCLNEFILLERLHKKHNKYLEIVTIVIDDDLNALKDFLAQSGYSWKFLHFDNQPDVLQQYDIRTFPTYYLINHEGKLSMSPAVTPNEGLEGILFKKLRAAGLI